MLKSGIPEDLEEMIKDIIAHRELDNMEKQYEGELLYIELPYYDEYGDNIKEEKEWKIEITV